MTGFVFQPKPEGDHYIEIHLCYKRITDGKVTTAALLSVLEYLAKTSLESSDWAPGDRIPGEIRINEDCNFPRLHRLLDGMMGITAIRDKLKLLEQKNFIRIDYSESARRRCVFYSYEKVSEALQKVDLTPQKVRGRKTTPQKVEGDPSKSGGLTPQKVDPSNTLSNSSSNPTLSLSDRMSEGRECDASLQPAQPATQPEEINPPVNPDPEDPKRSKSATQGSGQLETVGQSQEFKFSAAPLAKIKLLLNRLSVDHVPGSMRQEWRMSGSLPWRDKKTGDVPSEFASFVGKSLMFKGAQESMTALEKGRRHIRNAESTVAGMQGLIDSWESFSQRQAISVIATSSKPQEVPRTPMPDSVRRKWKSRIGRFAHVS